MKGSEGEEEGSGCFTRKWGVTLPGEVGGLEVRGVMPDGHKGPPASRAVGGQGLKGQAHPTLRGWWQHHVAKGATEASMAVVLPLPPTIPRSKHWSFYMTQWHPTEPQ